MSVIDKYDRGARDYQSITYADPEAYFSRKARLVCSLGPAPAEGEVVLDLSCGDGAFAPFVHERGLVYRGVDLSTGMIDVARERFGHVAAFEVGDMNRYEPAEPVAVTLCFRALYYADDRTEFFRRVRTYTTRKLVFDFSPRRFDKAAIVKEVRSAGYEHVALRPFFAPTAQRLPGAALAALAVLERVPVVAPAMLRVRFSYLCAAW